MSGRDFKPAISDKYAPVAYDPEVYPIPVAVADSDFGELFHTMFRYAANIYDAARSGPGSQRVVAQIINSLVVNFVVETAAWLDGQTGAAPAPGVLVAQFRDMAKQAFKYDYDNVDIAQRVSMTTFVKGCTLWLAPRAYALTTKAAEMKRQLQRGKTAVKVVAEFYIEVPTAPGTAERYIRETACKELFGSSECRFVSINKVLLPAIVKKGLPDAHRVKRGKGR